MFLSPEQLGQNRKKWIDALRSGQYKQGKEYLCKEGSYCCLGVACDLFANTRQAGDLQGIVEFDGSIDILPHHIVELLGLRSNEGILAKPIKVEREAFQIICTNLTLLNDQGNYSFERIADVLESGAAWRETEKVD